MAVTLYIAATLDGYIARENGTVDFLAPFESENEDFGYSKFYQTVEGVILGRNTYDMVMQWVDSYPYGDRPSWLFSHRECPDEPGMNRFEGTAEEFVRNHSEKNLWLVGGADLFRQFHNASLIDRYMIFTIPVVIGRGIPLFLPGCKEKKFILEENHSYAEGVVMNTWGITH